MWILADENIDRPIVAWLRGQGHDVVEAATAAPEAADADLIAMSRRAGRIRITFDRDIGRLVQSDTVPHPGVVYLRIRGAGPQLWGTFQRIWPRIENGIAGSFVTVKNEQVRRRPLPIEAP
jgi:predicted nuclease of predicted toxin-antitoxin system